MSADMHWQVSGDERGDKMVNRKTDIIWVVMGGPSSEAEVSRRTAKAVGDALTNAGYRVELIEFEPATFTQRLQENPPACVFNALHGKYGEDGAIQHVLEMMNIPYTGSGPLASAITMDKVISKRLFQQAGLPTAPFSVYRKEMSARDIAADIVQKFSFPVVLKAAEQGSTIGITVVHRQEELESAIDDALDHDAWMLAEAYLGGHEYTVSVLNRQALPVIQIVPHSGTYDYASKYTAGATDYLVPAPIEESLQREMQELAVKACYEFGCCGVARVDFMTNVEGRPFILEINSVPGMTETSLVPKAAKAAGIGFNELCESILKSTAVHKL